MAKKAKKRMHKMPPLSPVDKLIYWAVMLLLAVLWLAVLFVPLALRERIAFADEMVVAKVDHASAFWLIVPWTTVFLMTFIPWSLPYQDRKPIFGRRNFRYGPPAWPKVYPLFMKNKPYVFVSDRTRKNRKMTALLLLAVLLISLIPLPWSLYGRDCLRSDGGIEEYNMFNVRVREFASGQVDSVEFEAYRHDVGGKYSVKLTWDVRVTLTTGSGKVYTFDYSSFRGDAEEETANWLTAMLRLKSRYSPGIITYSGAEHLEEVISDNNLNAAEAEMLYRLFGME